VWTTNYDKLIERAWELQRRQIEVKAIRADLNISDSWADTTLYKMHGTVGQGWLRLLGRNFFRDKWICLSG
jgi:hypothetical protein